MLSDRKEVKKSKSSKNNALRWQKIYFEENLKFEDHKDFEKVLENLKLGRYRAAYFHKVGDGLFAAGVSSNDDRFRFIEIHDFEKNEKILYYCGNFTHNDYKKVTSPSEIDRMHIRFSKLNYKDYEKKLKKEGHTKALDEFNQELFGNACELNLQDKKMLTEHGIVTLSENQAGPVVEHVLPCALFGNPGTGKTNVLNFATLNYLLNYTNAKVLFVTRSQHLLAKFSLLLHKQINDDDILERFHCYTYQGLVQEINSNIENDDFVEKKHFIKWMNKNKKKYNEKTSHSKNKKKSVDQQKFVFDEDSIDNLYHEYRNSCHIDKETYINSKQRYGLLNAQGKKLLHRIFSDYEKYTKKQNKVDCAFYPLDFSKTDDFLYDFLVIDEVQDFTPLQRINLYNLLKQECKHNLIIGGDPLQTLFDYLSLSSLQIKNEMSLILNYHKPVLLDITKYEINCSPLITKTKPSCGMLHQEAGHRLIKHGNNYYFFWYHNDVNKCQLITFENDKLANLSTFKEYNFKSSITLSPYYIGKVNLGYHLYNLLKSSLDLESALSLEEKEIGIMLSDLCAYYTTKAMNGQIDKVTFHLNDNEKEPKKLIFTILEDAMAKTHIARINPTPYQKVFSHSYRCPSLNDIIVKELIHMRSRIFNGMPENASIPTAPQDYKKISGHLEWVSNSNEISCELLRHKYKQKTGYADNRIIIVFDKNEREQVKKKFHDIMVLTAEDAKGLEFETVFLYCPYSKNQYGAYFKMMAEILKKNPTPKLNKMKIDDETLIKYAKYSIVMDLLTIAYSRNTTNLIVIEDNIEDREVMQYIISPIKQLFDRYAEEHKSDISLDNSSVESSQDVVHEKTLSDFEIDFEQFKQFCLLQLRQLAKECFYQKLKLKHNYQGNFKEAYRQYSDTKQQKFFKAMKKNNHETVLKLLETGEINIEQPLNGTKPLQYAVKHLHVECVKHLLAYKADVNAIDCQHRTPLFALSELNPNSNCYVDVFKILLVYGADPFVRAQNGSMPIFNLLQHEDSSLFDESLKLSDQFKFNIDSKVNGKTLLHIACQKGNLELVKLLIKSGANINCVDGNNQTPLFMATETPTAICKSQICQYLLDKGADANIARATDGKTPFLNILDQYLDQLYEEKEINLPTYKKDDKKTQKENIEAALQYHLTGSRGIYITLELFIYAKNYKSVDINCIDHFNRSAWDYLDDATRLFGAEVKKINELKTLLLNKGINLFRIFENILKKKGMQFVNVKSLDEYKILIPDNVLQHLKSCQFKLKLTLEALYKNEIDKVLLFIKDSATGVNYNTLLRLLLEQDYENLVVLPEEEKILGVDPQAVIKKTHGIRKAH